jgi:tryptophan synthase alpha subunit
VFAIYYVWTAGVTDSAASDFDKVSVAAAHRVVGSALVDVVHKSLGVDGKTTSARVPALLTLVRGLAKGVRRARLHK